MTAADVRRRRLEALQMHYVAVHDRLTRCIANAAMVPLRYLTGEGLSPVSDAETAAIRAWVQRERYAKD